MLTASVNKRFVIFTTGASCVIFRSASELEGASTAEASSSSFISLSTQASSRTIMASADIPVALAYSINAHGVNTANGTIPGQGLVSAYMKIHLQGGRGDSLTKSSDLSSEDKSSANGIINAFTKNMGYQSGARLL